MGAVSLKWLKDLIGMALLFMFGYCFFVLDVKDLNLSLPSQWLNVNTIFLGIVFEAIPFILLGVFVSSFIQIFVSERWIQKWIPKNPIIALIPAAMVSAIFPVCECAIIPVVRRLIKKGMPLHVGIVLLVGAPILNPIVFASTYYAFSSNSFIVYGRMGLAFILCMVIGFIVYVLFQNRDQLRWTKDELIGAQQETTPQGNKVKQLLFHASDEFFDMGKYLIVGAFIASLFQTFLDRSLLLDIGQHQTLGPLAMMGFAYVLSLCSEADAFVAASFLKTFTPSALLAFLVYGPMLDLKNTLMLFASFKTKFTLIFIIVVTISVYISVLLLQVMMG
ncbi:permease [Bacillus songklensis]|uniref:Permease n=1 Tax=Bacillus songklensis TaxID=1069116 RepID=A0ABV8B8N1_9BACI